MGPPGGVVLAIGLWLVVVVLAIAVGLSRLVGAADSRSRRGADGWLLLLTAGLPLAALSIIPFDDYAVRRWFPQGTPPWFVGCEILFGVGVWAVLASVILVRRRPIAPGDWIWAGALAAGVSAGAAMLWLGINSGW